MLYISSRNRTDSFTAHRALHNETAPDGGLFVPFHMPVLEREQLESLRNQTFCKSVAQVLNIFFNCNITDWDVDCAIGRNPVRMTELSHRLLVSELWHNPKNCYRHIEDGLHRVLCGKDLAGRPVEWTRIVIRIAILFGIFTFIDSHQYDTIDICVTCGDFTQPIAAWYARRMGLPIGKIICACNDNSAPWDLICRGEINTGLAPVSTRIHHLDVSCPVGLERLIFETLGQDEAVRFAQSCDRKGTYYVLEGQLSMLNDGLTATVVSDSRVDTILKSVYRTGQYIADPGLAIAYGAVQDHRARSGENNMTLLLGDDSPIMYSKFVSDTIGVDEALLRKTAIGSKE